MLFENDDRDSGGWTQEEAIVAGAVIIDEHGYGRPLSPREIERSNRAGEGPSLNDLALIFPDEPGGRSSFDQYTDAVCRFTGYRNHFAEPDVPDPAPEPTIEDQLAEIPASASPVVKIYRNVKLRRAVSQRISRRGSEHASIRLDDHPAIQGWTQNKAKRALLDSAFILGMKNVPSYDEFEEISSFFNFPRPRHLSLLVEGGFPVLRQKAAAGSHLVVEAPRMWTRDRMVEAGVDVIRAERLSTLFSRDMIRKYSRPMRMPAVNTIIAAWADRDGANGLLNYNRAVKALVDLPMPSATRWDSFTTDCFLYEFAMVAKEGEITAVPLKAEWNAFAKPNELPSVRQIERNILLNSGGPNNFSELRKQAGEAAKIDVPGLGRWASLNDSPGLD